VDIDEAFLLLVRSRSAALLRTALLLTGERGHAEDLVQEALLAVYRKRHRVRAPEALEQYVRTTMVRTHLNWVRRRSNHEIARPDVDEREVHPFEHDDTWTALSRLSPRQRAVVVLAYYEDLTDPRIAEVLAISVGAVKTHRARALAVLRSRLADHEESR
jgi:RNA polymerase sigma-70 factor (sigma-E family)